MKKTSLDVIRGIIEDLGGTSTAKTMVRVLEELRQTLSGGASGEPSGGSLVMHVTAGQDGGVIEFEGDKTFAQVYAQLQGGGDVIAHAEFVGTGMFTVMHPMFFSSDAIVFMAAGGVEEDGAFENMAIVMSSDGTISMLSGTNQNDGEDGEDGGGGVNNH